jgi:hypothetical protein
MTMVTSSSLLLTLNRAGILITGLLLGLITLGPNVMMSDSGTAEAALCAYTGLAASAGFAIGGVIGCMSGSWKALLPGLGLQILALFGWQVISQIKAHFRNENVVVHSAVKQSNYVWEPEKL